MQPRELEFTEEIIDFLKFIHEQNACSGIIVFCEGVQYKNGMSMVGKVSSVPYRRSRLKNGRIMCAPRKVCYVRGIEDHGYGVHSSKSIWNGIGIGIDINITITITINNDQQ